MRSIKSGLAYKSLTTFLAGAMIWTLCFASGASAQRREGIIDAGNTIVVRTNESINANDSDGRVFTGVVEQDVVNRGGYVAIPRGSDVELIVRRVSNTDVALDLVTSGDSFSLRQQVREGGLDVAVAVVDPDDLDGLEVGARGPQRFVIVLPDDHPRRVVRRCLGTR